MYHYSCPFVSIWMHKLHAQEKMLILKGVGETRTFQFRHNYLMKYTF